jgi:hydrogenase large subunit
MRALNAFEGKFYLETLEWARVAREMFSLMEGRHAHPSTLVPGGVSTTITIQTLTDYYLRLMRYIEFVRMVPYMYDDLYDFFYRALPGYERVGERETQLICAGSFDDPDYCDYSYENMRDWGRRRLVTPGVMLGDELVTTDLVEINLNIRVLLGHSYYSSWEDEETFVERDPLGNKVDQNHPWNKTTIPRPKKRDFHKEYSWVTSPRYYARGKHLAVDSGGGPLRGT